MAKGNLKVEIDKFFIQTRITRCITLNCANRVEFECNLKEIEMKDGKCSSLVFEERNDLLTVKKP